MQEIIRRKRREENRVQRKKKEGRKIKSWGRRGWLKIDTVERLCVVGMRARVTKGGEEKIKLTLADERNPFTFTFTSTEVKIWWAIETGEWANELMWISNVPLHTKDVHLLWHLHRQWGGRMSECQRTRMCVRTRAREVGWTGSRICQERVVVSAQTQLVDSSTVIHYFFYYQILIKIFPVWCPKISISLFTSTPSTRSYQECWSCSVYSTVKLVQNNTGKQVGALAEAAWRAT